MFNAVISSFEKSQQWQRALALLQEMPMKKVTWRCPGGLKGIPGGCGCPQKGWNTFPRSSLGKRHEKKTWTISIQNMDQNHFAEALCCTPAESCQLNQAVSQGFQDLELRWDQAKWASTLSSAPLRKGTNGSWPLVVVGELWLWPVIPEICKTFVDIHCYHCDFVFCCLIIPEKPETLYRYYNMHIYIQTYIHAYIWLNYNDLTATSLES